VTRDLLPSRVRRGQAEAAGGCRLVMSPAGGEVDLLVFGDALKEAAVRERAASPFANGQLVQVVVVTGDPERRWAARGTVVLGVDESRLLPKRTLRLQHGHRESWLAEGVRERLGGVRGDRIVAY